MRLRARMPTTRCCTRRKIGPVVVVDEAGRHAMEAADKSKTEGTIIMPTTIPDPPEVGGVKPAAKTDTGSSRQTSGTVAEKAIEIVSARRSAPIRTNLHPVEPNKEIGTGGTISTALKEPKMDRAQPL